MAAGLELTSEKAICAKCGLAFGRRKGNFSVCYGTNYRGIGHLHICKDCVEEMYGEYLAQCKDVKMATRQMCRKLDLYWNERICEQVMLKSATKTTMTQYIAKINTATYAGRSYDTTLIEEGTLWNFSSNVEQEEEKAIMPQEDEDIEVSPESIEFWGPGYSKQQYHMLDQRLNYWKSRLPHTDEDFDIGTETIIKQICALEIDININRAANRSVDKQLASLNTLLGSANLKPNQKSNEESALEKLPLGVMAKVIEGRHPIAEPSERFKDVDGISKYITTWYLGHAGKMLGEDNVYSKLYDRAVQKLRVEHPEFDDEDDDEFLYNVFGGDDD